MKKLLCAWLPISFLLSHAYAQSPVAAPDTTANQPMPIAAEQNGSESQSHLKTTGAATTLSTDAFNKGPIIYSPLQLIQGRVPGLAIMRTGGGDPLQKMQVHLRGISTLYGNTDLLYVIDGVQQASLNTIMPEDIASIEVLRSASATAAYGVRGANGVILITTKKGEQGKPTVSYGAYGYFETVSKKAGFLTASEWRQLKKEWAGSTDPGLQKISINTPDFGGSTDWLREIRQQKVSQLHSLSVSGGTAKTRYYAAANYRNLNPALRGSGNSQFNGRVTLSQLALKDKLKLDGSFSITPMRYSQYAYPFPDRPEYALFDEVESYNPTVPLDGTSSTGTWNPIRRVNIISNRHNRSDWLAQVGASYRITKGLTLKAMLAEQQLHHKYLYNRAYEIQHGRRDEQWNYKEGENTKTVETTLNYYFSSFGHNITLQAGYAGQQFRDTVEQRDSFRRNGQLTELRGMSLSSRNRIASLLGMASYDYKNRYYLSAGLRRDQSSRYNRDQTPQYYPSYNIGWRIHNEAFLGKQTWLSELTLRAGYGITGKQLDFPKGFSGMRFLDPDFHGEKITELDFGLDIGLLTDRLGIHVDYYNRFTHDVIVNLFETTLSGEKYVKWQYNDGKLQNRGWEVAVNARPLLTPSFKWSTALNASFNQNELLFEIYLYPNSLMKGQPVGMMYGFPFAGFDEKGMPKYLTKDGQKGDLRIGSEKDVVDLGNGSPKTHFGFSNGLTYRRLEVTVLLRGAAGFRIHNRHRAKNVYEYSFRANQLREVRELDYNVMHYSGVLENYSDYFIEKGDFVKIDNVTLGYTLPLKSRFLQHLKVYASGHNLATLTRFKGLDPEMAGINGVTPGVYTRNTYFATRVWSFGVNAAL